jgi:hypothetical protein
VDTKEFDPEFRDAMRDLPVIMEWLQLEFSKTS